LRRPRNETGQFQYLAGKFGFPGLRFHDLRGTHETLLLDKGAVHVVAARSGQDPAVLLRHYAMRTRKADATAANVIGTMTKGAL
jgi:integrase